MIKEKDLREMRPQVRYSNGQNINLNVIQQAVQQKADEFGIPVSFTSDQVKYGGLIGGSVQDCLVLFHPEHEKDYFRVAIRVKHQGNYAFVSVNDFGTSRLLGNQSTTEYTKDVLRHGSGAEKVGAVIGKGIRLMVKGTANKTKLEEEQNWYTMVSDIFDNILE